jgi:lipoprotein-anchoring transpeptidase ErfK/SrfK
MIDAAGKGKPISQAEASKIAYEVMFDKNHQLIKSWLLNDFGPWAWNLKKGGQRTAYYIHTTPDTEYAVTNKQFVILTQSHGCIHIRPQDRDEMMSKGYLKEGIHVEVKPYGQVGPPP